MQTMLVIIKCNDVFSDFEAFEIFRSFSNLSLLSQSTFGHRYMFTLLCVAYTPRLMRISTKSYNNQVFVARLLFPIKTFFFFIFAVHFGVPDVVVPVCVPSRHHQVQCTQALLSLWFVCTKLI